jgi:hypothetical protein
MFQCICGQSFTKKINYGRHLIVHKNISLDHDDILMDKNCIEEYQDSTEDEINEEICSNDFDEQNVVMNIHEENSHISQEENYRCEEESDMNENLFDRQEDNIFIQQFNKENENFSQIPYNLISEECYEFTQLV